MCLKIKQQNDDVERRKEFYGEPDARTSGRHARQLYLQGPQGTVVEAPSEALLANFGKRREQSLTPAFPHSRTPVDLSRNLQGPGRTATIGNATPSIFLETGYNGSTKSNR